MSSTNIYARKTCQTCLKYVKIHITCFKCDAVYHIYCWKDVPGAYVNKRGQLFCCGDLTSNLASANTNLETQDNPPERVIVKAKVDGYKKDVDNTLIKEEDSEWNEFKCDACPLECTNNEHLVHHYNECPNKVQEFIQGLKEDKDLENCPIKEEHSEWNEFKCDSCHLEFMKKEHLENHCSECPNKDGGFVQELKQHKELEYCLHKEEDLEWSEFRCGACLLEFTNKEYLENHCNKCPNKEGRSIQELKEHGDVQNHCHENENSKPNAEHLKDHCSENPNKQGGSVPGLNKDKAGLFCSLCKEGNLQKESHEQHTKRCHLESSSSQSNKNNNVCTTNTKWNPVQVDDKEKKYKRTVGNYFTHVEGCVVKRIRIHNNEKSFECDTYGYTIEENKTLMSHFSPKHYHGKEKYDSMVCAISTPLEDASGGHQQICTSEKLYKCDYAAAQKEALNVHVLAKHYNAHKEYKCQDCKYSTYRKDHLLRHIHTHINERLFKCDMCDHAATRKIHLKEHVLAKHSNEKRFKCDRCDYGTTHKSSLKFHMLNHSNAEKEYKCRYCEYSTHRKANLVTHIRTHTNEKPFKCDRCDYAAIQKGALNVHIKVKHSNADKKYKCRN